MQIHFTKMHGLGNDFVVIDAIDQPIELGREQLQLLADRRFGVGCDQVLLVEPPRNPNTQFFYRIFNADGGEVEQCGNGARCFARYVHDKGLTERSEIPVGTRAGDITLYLEDGGDVRVDMGVPRLAPKQIPFVADGEAPSYRLDVDGASVEIGAVSMGNPHAVLLVDDAATAPVATLGPRIERHARFPRRANVGFMQVRDRGRIALRVYERGAGETLACGTGACAAVVYGRVRGMLDERVRVDLRGGSLVVSWRGIERPVWMAGPAVSVYEGSIDLTSLTRAAGRPV